MSGQCQYQNVTYAPAPDSPPTTACVGARGGRWSSPDPSDALPNHCHERYAIGGDAFVIIMFKDGVPGSEPKEYGWFESHLHPRDEAPGSSSPSAAAVAVITALVS